MKISLVNCSFNFELTDLNIEITPEEIKQLKTTTVRHVTDEIKAEVDRAVDNAVEKIKEAPKPKAASKKKVATDLAAPRKVSEAETNLERWKDL